MAARPAPLEAESVTAPTALLRALASVDVGDLVQSIEDERAWKLYAALVARVVAIRDGSAS